MVHLDPGGWVVISLSNRSLYHSRVYVIPTCNATAGICNNWWVLEKKHVSGQKHGKTRMQSVGSMLCQFSIVVHCIPRVYVIPIVGLSGSHSKRYIPSKKNIDSDMLCWQDGSFLGLETQIDPYTSSGYMLALFAMLLQEYAGIDESWKKHVSGVKHGKTRMQSVGFMLCLLSIVVHCCPLLSIVSPGSMWSTLLDLQVFFTCFYKKR